MSLLFPPIYSKSFQFCRCAGLVFIPGFPNMRVLIPLGFLLACNQAQARYLLKKEKGTTMQNPTPVFPSGTLARAMAAIEGWNDFLDARQQVGQYLTLSPEKRLNWSFSR
jgi:hypothetical protein